MRTADVPKAGVYLLANAVTGLLTLLVSVLLFAAGGVLAVVVVGLPLLAGLVLVGLPVAAVERRLQRLIDARPLPSRHRVPPEPGLASWLRTRYTEPGTWRELGFAGLLMTVLWPVDLLAVVLGVTVPPVVLATPVLFGTIGDAEQVNVLKAVPVTSWPQAFLAGAVGLFAMVACACGLVLLARLRAALARLVLHPRRDLDQTVVELTRSRVRLVDAFEAERSRIERDLHDGAQQRLVALSVLLGLARLDAPDGPLAEQLSRAHDEAGQALVELRELIRGIHPPVLTDFGLEAAIADLADRCPVPLEVSFAMPQRFSAAVESAAYFVVSEALANLAKHSGASRGTITGSYAGRTLTVEIADNGCGGARIDGGTGLIGLADRVSVVGGRLSLSSPPGGPTRLIVEIPCQACG
ncbi:Signal transduction histidine kinase [Actinoplanes philippinensis]|uniref:histidine kinase n=1 Tax=Actinoplanes philippinensis TaxID=35752 RepID=A0A1I2E6T0_9ACTN|nr:sensor histidine kinase [Actinoplanes philippinensis]SFE88191.1 Signal transduction histidine kinase [Actinoplanes philippinensis]